MSNQLLFTISQKLQQVRGQSLIDKKREKQQAQGQLQLIQSNLIERKQRENAEINRSKEHLQQLNNLLQQTLRSMTIQTSKETEKVSCLREELQTRVEEAQRLHQQKMEEVLELSEERVMSLSEDIQKKSKLQRDQIESSLNNLSKKLITLQRDFKQESENRKIGVERMKQTFYQELDLLKEVVEREQERRVSSERKIQAMIEQIQQKLDSEIEGQTAKRKKNNQAMLKLIEVACQKIQQRSSE